MQRTRNGTRAVLLAVLIQGAATVWVSAEAPRAKPVLAIGLDQWFVLGPIPISTDPAPAPDVDAQKKAFETDLLAPCDGETRVRATPPPPCAIGGHSLAW